MIIFLDSSFSDDRMHLMALDALEVFCNVARYRSFSKGAERSGVTQSAASQRVRALEEEVGIQLIDRSTRPLRLTPAGRTYYQGCRRILDRYARLLQSVGGEAREIRGHLELGSIYSVDRDLLSRALDQLRSDHPELTVQVVYLHPSEVHDAVRTDRCDLGILSYPDRWSDLSILPLRAETMSVVCHPGHPLARLDEATPGVLNDATLVGFDPGLPISRDIQSYLRRHGAYPEVARSFDNIDTIKASLADPAVVAILPIRTVQMEVERGLLRAIPLQPGLSRPVGLVHRRDREFSPALEALVNALLQSDRDLALLDDPRAFSTAGAAR